MTEGQQSVTFSYVKYDEHAVAVQGQFKAAFESLERMVMTLEPSRPRSLVMTSLEEAYMWVGKAVRDEQYKRNKDSVEQPERNNE